MDKPVVTIIGGGFGGFNTAKRLLRKGFKVSLISDSDFFTFFPLLPEVATGSLRAADICFKYKDYFKSQNFEFFMGKVTQVNFDANEIKVNGITKKYEYLVVATGSKSRVINPVWSMYGLTLKTLDDAINIRTAVVVEAKKDNQSNINIVGGGPTGVEIVFGIKQLLTKVNKKHKSHLQVFHGLDKLFPFLSDPVRFYTEKLLRKEAIDLHTNTMIDFINDDAIGVGDRIFPSDITILTAGVVPNTEMISKNFLDEEGNIIVNDYLQIETRPNVFALGDPMIMGKIQIPNLAQTATVQAKYVANNIHNIVRKKKLTSYKLSLKGQLISLGTGRAIGDVKGTIVKGRLAYLLRCVAYLMKMPRLKNKFRLLSSWTVSACKACIPGMK